MHLSNAVSRLTAAALMLIMALGLASCGGPSTPTLTPIPTISPELMISAKLAISQLLTTEPSQINVISAQRQDWPDSCLGLGQPNEDCKPGGIAGWLMVIEVNHTRYKVRLNETATTARIAGELPSQ